MKEILNPKVEEPEEPTEEESKQEVEIPPLTIKDIPDNALKEIENTENKKKLIFLIQKYQDSLRFGKLIKYELGFKETFPELSEKSEMDLENMVHRIRSHLDNKHLDKFYENMATTVAITYEQTMSLLYPIPNFSDMLLENDDFWNSYERFRIESEFPSVNPLTQMAFMIAQTTIIAHHTSQTMEDDDSYTMEQPQALETIMEEIERPNPSPTSEENKEMEIEEIVLGQSF
jgi:hypothetical protein